MSNRSHERTYSGWDEAGAEDGVVRRYDTTRMRWVELDLDEVPDRVIERNRTRTGTEATDANVNSSSTGQAGAITDVQLTLTDSRTKYAVESFVVTVTNRGTEPLTIDRMLLTFDGTDETSAPIDAVRLDPDETAPVDVHWSWIHTDQEVATIEIRSGSESIATSTITVDDYA